MKLLQKLMVVGSVILSSCATFTENKRMINDNFPETVSLNVEKIRINETLKAQAITLLEDFLIVQNDYIAGEDCFFVYTRDKIKFCYSFGKIGQSGRYDEFTAPQIIQNNTGNTCAIFDHATRVINYYKVTSKEFTLIGQSKIYDGASREPLQEISFVNDSIILFLNYKADEVCSYNLTTKTIVDRLSFQTDIKEKFGSGYNPTFDALHFCNKGSQVAVGFQFINRIIIGKLDKNYRFVFSREKIKSNMQTGKDAFLTNTFYYMFMLPSNEYLFAQYMGMPFKVFQPAPINRDKRNFQLLMEVYDWEQNKKMLIDFKHDVLRFTIDEQNKCMYTWNPLEDFDYLLKYSFDI